MVDFNALAAPFPVNDIKWRVGFKSEDGRRGSALAYVDVRTVMNRLDEVLTPAGWASDITPLLENGILTGARGRITVFMENGDVWREDIGAAPDGQEALKGAASDALKRAAVQFGVARYLYALPSTWVDLDTHGRLQETPALPDWALLTEDREAAPEERPARRAPRARWRE